MHGTCADLRVTEQHGYSGGLMDKSEWGKQKWPFRAECMLSRDPTRGSPAKVSTLVVTKLGIAKILHPLLTNLGKIKISVCHELICLLK